MYTCTLILTFGDPHFHLHCYSLSTACHRLWHRCTFLRPAAPMVSVFFSQDPCVGCCVSELNIFDWPKTDHGSSSEANCSQLHPSFGDSKVRRTCRVNDIWDPVDIGSCTFKNTTTRSTPILLFNATVNDNNTDTVRQTLNEQVCMVYV